MASRIAHDLRNPLAVIKSGLDLVELKYVPKDKNAPNHLASIRRATDRMSHQIDDVLDFVRTRPLQLSKVDLCLLSELVVQTIKKPDDVLIDLKYPQPQIFVRCDKTKIEVLLSNLISNAVDAVGQSGTITVSVDQDKENVIITVQDTGPGILPQMLDKIFEPLVTTKEKGTGLGLASCSNIVKQHNGTITVKNDPTRFVVKIPKKTSEFDEIESIDETFQTQVGLENV